MPVTPFDVRLRELLGEARWERYATDNRRPDVAELLTTAAAEGRDIDALITHAVTCREWEDDPTSPARRVGGVLRHRIEAAIASGEYKTASADGGLPSEVAQAVAHAAAPAGSSPKDAVRAESATEAQLPSRHTRPQPDRERG